MISLSLAQELKTAGLVWKTAVNDFFGLPDRGMDERVFVLGDMQTQTDLFRGWPVITFHGASEWALDYILTTEAVWLPTESQLRQAIFDLLKDDADVAVQLTQTSAETVCQLKTSIETQQFSGQDGAEVYGRVLLHLFRQLEQ